MPLPRVRFTVRRMMVATAIAGLVLGLGGRHAQFRRIAEFHSAKYRKLAYGSQIVRVFKIRWHAAMAEKYAHASRYPFLPVAPDPPEPE